MFSFLQLTRWNSERLSNLFKVTQQTRGWAISLILELVPLTVMTSFCTSERTSEREEGEMKTTGLPGGPCCVRSLNAWKQASNLELRWRNLNSVESCWEFPSKSTLEAPKEREREGKGKGDVAGRDEVSRLETMPGRLGWHFVSGWSLWCKQRNKRQNKVGDSTAWITFSMLCPQSWTQRAWRLTFSP